MIDRIFSDYVYGSAPRQNCWWDETCDIPQTPCLSSSQKVDVAIVGAGFTGLSAARRLAKHGASVLVLDAHDIGWGASGRNGGFCCLGGGKAEDAELDRRFGKAARLEFRAAEKAAVQHVEQTITELCLDVDRHSNGETELAHRAKDMRDLRQHARTIKENYGVEPTLVEKSGLAAQGMAAGAFYGALTVPIGFGLNPRKYINGLAEAARNDGAKIYGDSPVHQIEKSGRVWRLTQGRHQVEAEQVIVATNGYSSENVPNWLASRYMPSQSSVLVTRPLTNTELQAQGWTSRQMSYDTRNLLHYFRLMPDSRFLFGMRGGLMTGPAAEARAYRRVRADFDRMFPAWSMVESTHTWSGMVSLARRKLPFVGSLPEHPGLWAALCYHGNGVAMGSFSGDVLAEILLNASSDRLPVVMRTPLEKFPLRRARRLLMPPLYLHLMLKDI